LLHYVALICLTDLVDQVLAESPVREPFPKLIQCGFNQCQQTAEYPKLQELLLEKCAIIFARLSETSNSRSTNARRTRASPGFSNSPRESLATLECARSLLAFFNRQKTEEFGFRCVLLRVGLSGGWIAVRGR
jgi:hypothetical protein